MVKCMPIIFYSKLDLAGTNIVKFLRENFSFKNAEIVELEKESIRSDEIVAKYESDFFVFASRHKSETGKPSFTVHVPGNWAKAEAGGREKNVSWSYGSLMKDALLALGRLNSLPVFMEADHHGPFCKCPAMFFEIGSSEREWKDEKLGMQAAWALNEIMGVKPGARKKYANVFGVGGGHYCPTFTRRMLDEENGVAVAHVLQKYYVDEITPEIFGQGIERSREKIERVEIDWKGLTAPQREKVQRMCKDLNVEIERL
ncbi:D-aminoacyl-tRNA deacylase [Candidatus Gugararchaeum adminiculabundum]|nr:D-aminoacyl-tRNA deacylase [Candidatus Gugararchaeum adminiculabundum]